MNCLLIVCLIGLAFDPEDVIIVNAILHQWRVLKFKYLSHYTQLGIICSQSKFIWQTFSEIKTSFLFNSLCKVSNCLVLLDANVLAHSVGVINFNLHCKQFLLQSQLLGNHLVSFCLNIIFQVLRDHASFNFKNWARRVMLTVLEHVRGGASVLASTEHLLDLGLHFCRWNFLHALVVEVVPLSVFEALHVGEVVATHSRARVDQDREQLVDKWPALEACFQSLLV